MTMDQLARAMREDAKRIAKRRNEKMGAVPLNLSQLEDPATKANKPRPSRKRKDQSGRRKRRQAQWKKIMAAMPGGEITSKQMAGILGEPVTSLGPAMSAMSEAGLLERKKIMVRKGKFSYLYWITGANNGPLLDREADQ
tara:strand:- start:22163 stop:22582 length:420 start_codon:yes stop_codon:yes gene_type:complete